MGARWSVNSTGMKELPRKCKTDIIVLSKVPSKPHMHLPHPLHAGLFLLCAPTATVVQVKMEPTQGGGVTHAQGNEVARERDRAPPSVAEN